MSRSRTDRKLARLLAGALAAVGAGLWLAGCSDNYLDRRETVSLGAGDAIAANTATQEIDPWPANSGNKNIAFNGPKMQTAVQRYRTNKVIPPVPATTSDVITPPAADVSGVVPSSAVGGGAPAAASQ